MSRIIGNGAAVRQAVQVRQQHHQVIQQNIQMQRRRRSVILNPPPAPPEGQSVEYDVTTLGLEVRQSYTIKEAVIGGGFHQFELIDAVGKVRCVGAGDRDDALLQIARPLDVKRGCEGTAGPGRSYHRIGSWTS